MWDYQLRAYRKKRKKLLEDQERRIRYHMTRIWAEIQWRPTRQDDPVQTPVRFILNDLTDSGVTVFSTRGFSPGQKVGFFIPEPRPFYVEAEIGESKLLTLRQSVLTQTPLPYRISMRFLVYTTDEKSSVQNFCSEAFRQYISKASGNGIA